MYRAIDLFAGIGGIRRGFDNAFGQDVKTVFVSEWDKFAQKTYLANYQDDFSIAGDITQIDEKDIPEFDICLAGFPCQAFSLAGKRMGFNDDYKGMCRGTLFQDIVRICEYHKPKVIFCENVKGLTVHDRGRTFKVIKRAFEQIGYKVYSEVLNSKDFGVPQNRERIYIVAFRRDIDSENFCFPEGNNPNTCIEEIMEDAPIPSKYYLSDVYVETLRAHKARHEAKGNGFGYEIRELKGQAGAIVCGGMGRERNLIIDEREHSMIPTTHIKGRINREGIRKMTPREWARLQGFPDDFKLELADTHLYKQLGNSVTVNVIEAIAQNIKKVLEYNKEKRQKMIRGNKGEWSELYVLARLLSYGKLYAADENTKRIDELYFPILKILREEGKNKKIEYLINPGMEISLCVNDEKIKSLNKEEINSMADYLYSEINDGGIGSFSIDGATEIMQKLECGKIKASSSDKTDITMQIHDANTGYNSICGFSIKSELGNPPTLLNAGKTTNFVYEIIGINDDEMNEINSISTRNKIMDRINRIFELGDIKFIGAKNEKFASNLMLIDSRMEEIIGEMLLFHYKTGEYNCKQIIEVIENSNPLNYPRKGFYEYKFKKLLCSVALGMMPGKIWDGHDEANGGYIIVTNEGDVLAYHIYNRDFFETYLLNSTRFERGSTGRHDFASIYKENGRMYINLNLQIRFK